MPSCTQCARYFNTEQALHAHCSAKTDHPYCVYCERLFIHDQALQHHLEHAGVHQDESDEEYDEYGDIDDGSDNEEAYCASCDRHFINIQAMQHHLEYAAVHQYDSHDDDEQEYDDDDSDDDSEPYCTPCGRHFINKEALYQHLGASSLHNWCFVCCKDFSSPTALFQHHASRVHKPADLKCPLCPRVFKSPSDIASHIESGGCNNKVNRHHVTAAVHALNLHPTISVSRRIAGPTTVTTTYLASELAFNGKAYECYVCHRQFKTLSSLNTHLGSPVHDAKEFKCPHTRCSKKFTVISALIRHIESEACGLAKFQVVEDYTLALTSQFQRMLTI